MEFGHVFCGTELVGWCERMVLWQVKNQHLFAGGGDWYRVYTDKRKFGSRNPTMSPSSRPAKEIPGHV